MKFEGGFVAEFSRCGAARLLLYSARVGRPAIKTRGIKTLYAQKKGL